ncbi:YSIRK-type signal peptide-containing protein [Staphylococcus petrasii]|uniref:YSIRK-type signal peptide-containing protein n=1 Tax=Staphylococcus petrasii TaxID=1276936 RepID=UPI00107EABC6|nr:YSIRK-type signal peptide-containing protein [Staphylococcus petrasii]
MRKKQNKRLDFLPNRQNKYSIRKFTVGTASILVGATLIFGSAHDEAKAAEKDQVTTTSDSSQQSSVKEKGNVQTVEKNSSQTEQVDVTHQPQPSTEEISKEATTQAPSTEETSKEATTQEPSTEEN